MKSWQFAFNRLNDLPEILTQRRERAYLAWIFATKSTRHYAIDSATLQEYTRQYSEPGAMRAGFAWYRPDCGHFLPEECPVEMTDAVLKFWQSTR